jgi:hypothetical protein
MAQFDLLGSLCFGSSGVVTDGVVTDGVVMDGVVMDSGLFCVDVSL